MNIHNDIQDLIVRVCLCVCVSRDSVDRVEYVYKNNNTVLSLLVIVNVRRCQTDWLATFNKPCIILLR